MTPFAVAGYELYRGSVRDHDQVLAYLQYTYQELYPTTNLGHLARTVEQYLSAATPLWWVAPDPVASPWPSNTPTRPIAGLWAGSAWHQATGDRHTYIFLLYVQPEHRRRGIGRALLQQVEHWAQARGDRHLALQVLQSNQAAQHLYAGLGYQTEALLLMKPVGDRPELSAT